MVMPFRLGKAERAYAIGDLVLANNVARFAAAAIAEGDEMELLGHQVVPLRPNTPRCRRCLRSDVAVRHDHEHPRPICFECKSETAFERLIREYEVKEGEDPTHALAKLYAEFDAQRVEQHTPQHVKCDACREEVYAIARALFDEELQDEAIRCGECGYFEEHQPEKLKRVLDIMWGDDERQIEGTKAAVRSRSIDAAAKIQRRMRR